MLDLRYEVERKLRNWKGRLGSGWNDGCGVVIYLRFSEASWGGMVLVNTGR